MDSLIKNWYANGFVNLNYIGEWIGESKLGRNGFMNEELVGEWIIPHKTLKIIQN